MSGVSLIAISRRLNERAFRALDMDDTASDGNGDGLRSVLGAELRHDVFDVNFDRLRGDLEALANVAIALALCNPSEHLEFARTELVAREMVGQVLHQLRRHVLAARVDLANDLDELIVRRTFQDIATRTGFERAPDLIVSFESREYDESSVGELGADCRDRADAVLVRQPQIHERDIGPMTAELFDSLPGCSRHGYKLHVRLLVDDRRNALAKQGMVIDTEDADALESTHCLSRCESSLASQYSGSHAAESVKSCAGRDA